MHNLRNCERRSETAVLLSAFLAVCALGEASVAQESDALDAEILLDVRIPTDLQYSHQRGQLAFVVSESADKSGGLQSVWIFDRRSGKSRQVSSKAEVNAQPRWCPDSDCLTFLSNRDGSTDIYRLPMAGGEAEKLFASDTDILTYEWSPKENLLAYVTNGTPGPSNLSIQSDHLNSNFDESVVVVHRENQRLMVFDPVSRTTTSLIDGDWRITTIRWAADGDAIVLSGSRDLYSSLEHDRLYLVSATEGELHELWRPDREISNIEVSPNGTFVAAIAARESGPEPFDLVLIDLRDRKLLNLTKSTIDRKIQTFKWRNNSSLVAVVAEGFESHIYDVSVQGAVKRRIDPVVSPGPEIVVSHELVGLVGGSFDKPPEIWLSESANQYQQVTSINADLVDRVNWPVPEVIRYESFDGLAIEAALYLPEAAERNSPLPLIVHVHGGPSSRWAREFRPSWAALLVSRGFAVLEPNIRGSTGRNYEFLVMNHNDLGGGDFKDVMSGLDYLVATGIADPERLGIGGWSYGGYMAAWAVTQTNRFKAAVSGAPVTNWVSEYGTESPSVNRYDRALLGSLYENMTYLTNVSPISYVRNAKTPTQLLCADDDDVDPIGQCSEFYRGLIQNDVMSEFIIYKGVGHSRATWSTGQQLDSMQRMLSWYQRHLLKQTANQQNQ